MGPQEHGTVANRGFNTAIRAPATLCGSGEHGQLTPRLTNLRLGEY